MTNPGVPICAKCRVTFRCEKNGIIIHEPDSAMCDGWRWKADLYRCPGCGLEIVTGYGQEPLPPDWPEPTTLNFAYNCGDELEWLRAQASEEAK